jgi:hypothetical protein
MRAPPTLDPGIIAAEIVEDLSWRAARSRMHSE